MKIRHILSGLILALILFSCGGKGSKSSGTADSLASTGSSEQTTTYKKYQIKSGIVTFDNDAMGTKHKSMLYFDDYGMKELIEEYEGDVVKTIDLCDGKMRYTITPEKKQAISVTECYRGIAYKFDWNEISQADKQDKVKKLPNMSVAGKDCEAFSMEGSLPSIFAGWYNICLYQETKSKIGTAIMKAVKIEENVSIPPEKFQVPAGYAVKKFGI